MTLKNSFGVALGAMMFSVLAAQAQEVRLNCKQNDGPQEGRVIFNQNAQTAGFAVSGFDVPSSPATFTEAEITWTYEYSRTERAYYALSRTTGTLKESGTGTLSWHCEVAAKKF